MKINDIYETFKIRKTKLPSEAKKNIGEISFKSEFYILLNAAIFSLLTESTVIIFGKKVDLLIMLGLVPFMFIALTGFFYGLLSLFALEVKNSPSLSVKLSKFMPYNLLLRIMPAKITRKINGVIFDAALPDSLIEMKDLKQLSSLVNKEDMNGFLRNCGSEPTYKKMMYYFESEESESIREEKITLLTESLYERKALNIKE